MVQDWCTPRPRHPGVLITLFNSPPFGTVPKGGEEELAEMPPVHSCQLFAVIFREAKDENLLRCLATMKNGCLMSNLICILSRIGFAASSWARSNPGVDFISWCLAKNVTERWM